MILIIFWFAGTKVDYESISDAGINELWSLNPAGKTAFRKAFLQLFGVFSVAMRVIQHPYILQEDVVPYPITPMPNQQ